MRRRHSNLTTFMEKFAGSPIAKARKPDPFAIERKEMYEEHAESEVGEIH